MGLNPKEEIRLNLETVDHVHSTNFPGHTPGEEYEWDFSRWQHETRLTVNRIQGDEMEFDLVGVDASVANALRRVLIAEVPSVAIETVYMWLNTSIIQDEVLSHRLGLVPLRIDPDKLEFPNGEPTVANTVIFHLNAECSIETLNTRKKGKGDTNTDGVEIGDESIVYSHQLEFKSEGDQDAMFGFDSDPGLTPRVANPDILLAKMAPGQVIKAEMHAVKGIGKDHAKFSPVATASYRLLPTIHITRPIPPALQDKFIACFRPGVLEKRDGQVIVVNPRKDTVSREALRHKEFEGMVELGRKRDHFIYTIESSGAMEVQRLFRDACKVMLAKIGDVKKGLDDMEKRRMERTQS
ncbi:RBP11-like subunits of RNA polymerase [Atractiella rhizophila]|nr:RBP11-like subunits of RNA polymerase [Atractiella rhizophila]